MNKHSLLAKISSCALSVILAAIPFIQGFAVENTEQTTDMAGGYLPDDCERLGATGDGTLTGLPSVYDPRNSKFMTDIKDQQTSILCWMYASSGLAEINVSKNFGRKFCVSPAHGAAATSMCIGSGNGYYNVVPDTLGNNTRALQYLTNWNNPIFENKETITWNSTVSESDFPLSNVFSNDDSNILGYGLDINDTNFSSAESLFNVTSANYVNGFDTAYTKAVIREYGGVATGVTTFSNYEIDKNGDYCAFTESTGSFINHMVTIIGWNDDYPKENFKNPAVKHNGAWLVKNSVNDTNRRFYWLSYDDGFLKSKSNNMIVITGIERANKNKHMLSYDYFPLKNNPDIKYSDDVYFCNVYNMDDYAENYDSISEVMFYAKATNSTYKLKIIPLQNETLPQNLDDYAVVSSGDVTCEGYITAKLEKPIKFSGGKYAFVLQITPKSTTSKIYIPYEGTFYYNMEKEVLPKVFPEIHKGESFYALADNNGSGIKWNDCATDNVYALSGEKGNLVIRPIVQKTNADDEHITLCPDRIEDTTKDVNITFEGRKNLFSIHTSLNRILRQGYDYILNDNVVTLKSSFLQELNGKYTEIVFDFNDNVSEKVVVNPRAELTAVKVDGSPIVGDTLSTTVTGIPEYESYDVKYQWQSSMDGKTWYDISNAVSDTYTITSNDFRRFIRVKVTAKNNGNVTYPSEIISSPTKYKTVILGDVDFNGAINIKDATTVNRHVVGLITLTDEEILAGDVNRDGKITIVDVTLIQKMTVS